MTVIFLGIVIGKYEMVDAGAVVSKSMSGGMIVVSNQVFGMFSGYQL